LASGTYFIGISGTTNEAGTFNFGQRAFAYTAPSGFKALNTQNLPASLVTKSNTVFDALIWSGDSVNNRKLTTSFGPDLFWAKQRNGVAYHSLNDSVRGPNAMLQSNTTTAEQVNSNGYVITFASDGVNVSNGSDINASGSTYVGWAWDAGTSTVSNTAGSITSQVRANATAGFSVVTYTGTGTAGATVGHGLGVVPAMILTKSRNNASDWDVYHSGLATPASNRLVLQSTAAVVSSTSSWNYTNPSSTVVTLGTSYSGNFSGYTHVMYAFSPVVGYNSISSYTGNGSSDGVFVYTGHRVRWLMIKRTDVADSWQIMDAARSDYNVADDQLYADLSNAESTTSSRGIDFLSNGFKIRGDNSGINASGGTYVYVSFAESPLNYSRAR